MGRYYVRKSTRGNYSSENLNKALADLQECHSYHSVSRKYAISRRTLQRHMKGPVRDPGCTKLGRFRTILSEEIETEIVHHALDMQQRFYGLTPCDIRKLACQLVESFPPHCTHRIQPLDLTFFGLLKRYYRSECDK